jgi:hypothetical protein
MPCNITSPNIDAWYMDISELATALVEVFMDQGTTKGRVFLWAASLQCQAEVMAILERTELLLSKNIMKRIHTCSKRRGAVAALKNHHQIGPGMGQYVMLVKLSGSNEVTIE